MRPEAGAPLWDALDAAKTVTIQHQNAFETGIIARR